MSSQPFSWKCPYCNKHATIGANNCDCNDYSFNRLNKFGDLQLHTIVTTCPNPECRELTLSASLHKVENKHDPQMGGYRSVSPEALMSWQLRPRSNAKPFPDYIPKQILDDYTEACLIASDSPKASATLARRCLQGMIRDFWKIKKRNLSDEIEAIKGKTDSDTWSAIDAIRSVGNIGAHMGKDVNLIVDIEPNEASLLIGVIELLLEEWYVRRHERGEHVKKVIALGAAKKAAKKATPATDASGAPTTTTASTPGTTP